MWRTALARLGFAATGILYIGLGVAAARVGLAGARNREAGVPGALRLILQQPHGRAILAAVAAGFAAFTVWHVLEMRNRRRGPVDRLGHLAGGLGYAALCWAAVALLLRLKPQGGAFRRSALEWLLSYRLGAFAVEAAGAVTIGAGLFEIAQGATGRLRNRFRTHRLTRDGARLLEGVARFGLAARGLVLVVIGVFEVRVAVDLDPRELREIGGALKAVSRSTAGGPMFAGVISLGLIAYGLYMATLALAVRR